MQESTKSMNHSKTDEITLKQDELLEHWQGHRRLTRKAIDAFPEDKLFSYSIGGMRPFSELAMEMIHMAAPGARGVATGEWTQFGEKEVEGSPGTPKTKDELLKLWDWSTDQINKNWEQIQPGRLQMVDLAFGQYEGKVWWHVLYFIDNEIHHRGQGYVYLRSLGIEPPYFWER
ncbi:DinB family protein [Membranihabitans maritimus]|uniref:DinB family protein n=1 Tax=Membranihabitans maritimus TaxID=2904244 RepID=UPI001F1A73D3|nr:DinB family protein [Membranihabitans maritimus]